MFDTTSGKIFMRRVRDISYLSLVENNSFVEEGGGEVKVKEIRSSDEDTNIRFWSANKDWRKISFKTLICPHDLSSIELSVTPLTSLLPNKPPKNNDTFELNLLNKFEKIEKVLQIHIKYTPTLVLVKVFIDMDTYDYDLMDKIFNEAEFPIKDFYSYKLIDFDYIPFIDAETSNVSDKEYKKIFDRQVNEAIFKEKWEPALYTTSSILSF